MDGIATLPEPPYTAVIFTARRSEKYQGYDEAAEAMVALAVQQPGYLGHESVEQADGLEITVSYWVNDEAARNWKKVAEHREAQRRGREDWYSHYEIRVARVERAYGHNQDTS
ncbi:MAG: antibiotic biosynthesis monooxygenase [Anaerolineae bacterium]|nr:MAG: antibiotic biosynthesis monooxygenase [Anaerolineae bacterium]